MPKDSRLHFRLDEAARHKLREVCRLTGLDEGTALRACIGALIEYVEQHGEIRLPLAVVPKSKSPPKIPTPSFPSTASRILRADPTPILDETPEVPPRETAVATKPAILTGNRKKRRSTKP